MMIDDVIWIDSCLEYSKVVFLKLSSYVQIYKTTIILLFGSDIIMWVN